MLELTKLKLTCDLCISNKILTKFGLVDLPWYLKLIFYEICDNCDKIHRFETLNISKFEIEMGKSDFK